MAAREPIELPMSFPGTLSSTDSKPNTFDAPPGSSWVASLASGGQWDFKWSFAHNGPLIFPSFPESKCSIDGCPSELSSYPGTRACPHVLPVCVPMYNEEASELYLTLKSVWRMEKNLRENGWPKLKFKICVIQDGWSKVSQSAREAMEKMFPSPDGEASVPSKLDEVVKSELREYLVPRSGEAPVVFDHLVPFSVYCDICQEVQRVQPLSSKKNTSKFDRPVTYRQMCIAYIEDGKELSHGQLNWRWQKLEKVPGSGNNLSLEDFKEDWQKLKVHQPWGSKKPDPGFVHCLDCNKEWETTVREVGKGGRSILEACSTCEKSTSMGRLEEAKRTLILSVKGFDVNRLRPANENGDREPQKHANLDVSFVVKIDNRKKHNSHDLFFRGFAARLKAKYVFATDCGTVFDPTCLTKIMGIMNTDESCIACTGRQRVMTRWQQPGSQFESCAASILRIIQGYDYEASTVVYNSCFSLFGVLPVIPGPCGLFRLSPLLEQGVSGDKQSPFDHYAAAAIRAEESQTLVDGNVVLAEDRVLTYAGLFLTKPTYENPRGLWQTRWANDSVFYFQSESTLQSLVAQRRRWLNGTVASYIYVAQQLRGNLKYGGEMPCCRRRPADANLDQHSDNAAPVHLTLGNKIRHAWVWFLTMLMLWIYVGIAVGPALYIFGGIAALRYLMDDYTGNLMFVALAIGYSLVYVAFTVRHHYVSYDARMFCLVIVANSAASGAMLAGIVTQWVRRDVGWAQWLGVFYVVLPILLNFLIPDWTSLRSLINPANILQYMLFMPTMQGCFLSLAIARTFDLSWGNRGGVGHENEKIKVESQSLMIIQGMLNFILVCLAINPSALTGSFNGVFAFFLLFPTGLISLFSAQQALGVVFFWIYMVLVFCFLGLITMAGDDALEFLPTSIKYWTDFFYLPTLGNDLIKDRHSILAWSGVVMVAVIIAVLLKGIWIQILCQCNCLPRRRPRASTWQGPCASIFTMTFLLACIVAYVLVGVYLPPLTTTPTTTTTTPSPGNHAPATFAQFFM